ncbi:tripartite tricarboxylate transporter TctB family protein, partial [Virgibacillus sp. DJP39]|uniref:tripartite tricarboxylate transporter TctB family protein n=1 Tax=Virgibacillus sp. DJP39 TaxID=3409790 RepID=UPI003BB7137F
SFVREWKKPLFSGITLLIYILCIDKLGFYVSTFFFLAVLFYLLGLRRPILFIANLVLLLSFSYMLFEVLLKLPLPTGIMF